MAMYSNQLARAVQIMAAKKYINCDARQTENRPILLNYWRRFSAEFPRIFRKCRRISKNNILDFLKRISGFSGTDSRTPERYFRNYSGKFRNRFWLKATETKATPEYMVCVTLVIVFRESA